MNMIQIAAAAFFAGAVALTGALPAEAATARVTGTTQVRSGPGTSYRSVGQVRERRQGERHPLFVVAEMVPHPAHGIRATAGSIPGSSTAFPEATEAVRAAVLPCARMGMCPRSIAIRRSELIQCIQ